MIDNMSYYSQQPRDDRRSLTIMAGLCIAAIALIIVIILVVIRNNTPLNPGPTKNLTIPEKTLIQTLLSIHSARHGVSSHSPS